MGNNLALDLATSTLGLRNALSIHLTSNHYPPVPTEMVEPCVLAIEAIDRRSITLPEGVLWRGQTTAPAWAVVEGHHLEAWLVDYEDEDEDEDDL